MSKTYRRSPADKAHRRVYRDERNRQHAARMGRSRQTGFLDPEFLFALTFFCVACLITVAALAMLDRSTCSAQWKNSGMPSEWSMLGGCRVKHNGLWIPESAYREVDK